MSPLTHLLASWIIAAKATDNPRDCRLVALAGVLPDADGAGILIDFAKGMAAGRSEIEFQYYATYHHMLLHGIVGGCILGVLLTLLARNRAKVFWLCLAVFHLHLLFDLLGSRGPEPEDLWPIFYLAPLSHQWMWNWKSQWPLNAWQNQVFTWLLLFGAFGLAVRRGDSFVGVFNRWADGIFVRALRAGAGKLKGGRNRTLP